MCVCVRVLCEGSSGDGRLRETARENATFQRDGEQESEGDKDENAANEPEAGRESRG